MRVIWSIKPHLGKTSSDGKVEGLSFRVTGPNGYEQVFTTNDAGEIVIEGLRVGEYLVSEILNEKSATYIDRIFVDEAHYYKNLAAFSKMRNVGGISQTEAQKFSDLYMKCRYLDELTGGKGVIFATGTPISNTMVEMYTMQKYLQYNTLAKNGLEIHE